MLNAETHSAAAKVLKVRYWPLVVEYKGFKTLQTLAVSQFMVCILDIFDRFLALKDTH